MPPPPPLPPELLATPESLPPEMPEALRLRRALRAAYGVPEETGETGVLGRLTAALRMLVADHVEARAELISAAVRAGELDIDEIADLDREARGEARRAHWRTLSALAVGLALVVTLVLR